MCQIQLWIVLGWEQAWAWSPLPLLPCYCSHLQGTLQNHMAQRIWFQICGLGEAFLVRMRMWKLRIEGLTQWLMGDPGLVEIQAPDSCPSTLVMWYFLPLVPFFAFYVEKGWIALFSPPFLSALLHLLCVMQLETHGVFVYYDCGIVNTVWRRVRF